MMFTSRIIEEDNRNFKTNLNQTPITIMFFWLLF